MRSLLALVLCSGCLLGGMNKEGLQLIVNDLKQARVEVGETAKNLSEVVVEINSATKEERAPVITEKMEKVSTTLSAAVISLDEAGKTAVTLQIGIGTPKPDKNLNFTSDQKDAWRSKYTMLANAYNSLVAWGKKALKMPAGVAHASPKPWSGADIGILITAITAGAGALGIGKKANTWRKGANEAEGLANIVKEKCNGDGEFANTITAFPTTQKRHVVRKANAL